MAGDHTLPLLWLLIAVVVNSAAHLTLVRIRPHANVVVVLLSAYVLGLAVLAGLQEWALTALAPSLLTYSAISYCYFHYVHIGVSSVRIQILRELASCPGGIRNEPLLDRYGAQHILQLRLDRMLDSGQIVLRDGHYHTGKPKMLHVAKVFAVLKRVVLGRKHLHERPR